MTNISSLAIIRQYCMSKLTVNITFAAIFDLNNFAKPVVFV